MTTSQNHTYEDALSMLQEYKATKNDTRKKQLQRLIVLIYMPIVKKIAYSIARRSTDPVEDIIQVGSIGLIKAIDNYDFSKNDNFKYFATPYITGEIKHYLRDYSSMIKAPRAIKELSYRIAKITERLTKENGVPPTDRELADTLQVSETQIQEYKNIERRITVASSDTPCDESENSPSVMDQIKDENQEIKRVLFEDKIFLDSVMEKLSNEEQDIIQMHFYEELNNQEIALRLNLSQKQVAILLQLAIEQLMKTIV